MSSFISPGQPSRFRLSSAVRMSVGNHVDDDKPNALLDIGRTLGDKGVPIARPVFVRGLSRTSIRPGQGRTAFAVVHQDLYDIGD